MGRKKSEPPSSQDLLSAEFIWTGFGRVCRKMEIICIKCGVISEVTATDAQIARIDREEYAGAAIIEAVLTEAGWVFQAVNRRSGQNSFYSVCPECVEGDFAEYAKFIW